MANNPTVSVIIPTYNRAYLVGRAIQSVLNQTYQGFEIIVVDDGSTDNTEEIIRNLNDPRIYYIRHEKNRGGSAARNTGIRAARGEYIAFLDSDDEWLPGMLSCQMQVILNAPRQIGVVYSAYWSFNREGTVKVYWPRTGTVPEKNRFRENIYKQNFAITSSALIKREFLDIAGGFDEKLPRLQDWELWMRLSEHCQFVFIDKPLVNKYSPINRIADDTIAYVKGMKLILQKHRQYIAEKRPLLGTFLYEIGSKLCQVGSLKEGRAYLWRSLRIWPFQPKHWVALMASFLGVHGYNALVGVRRKVLKLW